MTSESAAAMSNGDAMDIDGLPPSSITPDDHSTLSAVASSSSSSTAPDASPMDAVPASSDTTTAAVTDRYSSEMALVESAADSSGKPNGAAAAAAVATDAHSEDDDDEDGDNDAENDNTAEDDEDDDEDGSKEKGKAKGTKGGSSCHQCKSRRNEVALTYCTSLLDKKNKRCRKKFCGHCLKKFYKENPNAIPDKSNWKCPSCRKICCCAACRRRKQKDINGAVRDDTNTKQKKSKDVHSLYPLSDSPLLPGQDYRTDLLHHSFDSPHHAHTQHHHHLTQQQRLSDDKHSAGGDYADLSLASSHALDSSFMSTSATGGHDESGGDSAYNSDEDASSALPTSATSIPSPDFSSVLASHIALLADESVRHEGATAFGRLYSAARNASNSRRISAILQRTDVSKERKVELIANMLVALD